ncbi:MAG: alpha/beta hydrolase [Bacteroidales bacterium]|nr:alpha/beta hydrolase [Bacteroidales bacterium]
MKTVPLQLFSVLLLCILCTFHTSDSYGQLSHPCNTSGFGKNDAAGRYFSIRGISLYVEQYGKGRPLVMLHGNGGSIESFSCQIPYFETKYHVIAIDSRAQGKSNDPSDTLSFDMMADDVSALLDSLKLDSCFILGWSDGGITALMLALRHPEKVRGMAITGANLKPDNSSINPADLQWMEQEYSRLGSLSQSPEIRNQRKLIGLDLMEPAITADDLHSIHTPALIIGGDRDIIPVSHSLLIAQAINGAYLWILPNSTHSTLIDYPEEFNRTVDRFFSGNLHPE